MVSHKRRSNNKKKSVAALQLLTGFLCCLLFPHFSLASTGEVTGKILKIRSHDISVAPDWVQIDVPSAGGCTTLLGKAYFLFRDDGRGKRQISIAIAAKLAEKQVTVGFDDVGLSSGGVCFVRYIDVS